MKHTRGPWVVCSQVGLQYPVASIAMEGLKLNVAHVAGIRNGEGLANARLIAAAPDLLEALLETLYCVEAWERGCESVDYGRDRQSAIDQARAAIAKATGE